MKAAIISDANGPWVVQDVPTPEVGPGQIKVRVHACAICGTDLWMAHNMLSFRPFPLLLGHEGVGEVVEVGPGVTSRAAGDRVGMPMVQKGCGVCAFCREEHPPSFVTAANCANPILTGVTVDGAFAEYIVVDPAGTVVLPDGISYDDAAPTMCGGFTSWAALRRANPQPGATVAVVGIGGVGHFAVQYAKAAGYRTVAVTHSADKQALSVELGADEVIADGNDLKDLGGADVILHASSNHSAVLAAMNGLKPWGKVVMMGIAFDDMSLPALNLVSNSHQVIGSAHNGLEYLVEALDLVARGEVRPRIEAFAFADIQDAYERAASGDARFKSVVRMS
jgi:D-arabinose 1-dehydrogenase-like Zn-dependent alcohol dehydrogenase